MKEIIDNDKKLLGYFFNIADISKTEFVTSNDKEMQLGFHSYSKNSKLDGHVHLNIKRTTNHTSEFIQVVKGIMKVNIFDEKSVFCSTIFMYPGDCLLQFQGGHSFDMEKDVIMFELKQGPYLGNKKDKVKI